ncbi:unnamed protein product [Hermetia illucens]|uniref:Reverse transcriptase domain-containing protein n=1 Tax=Hermetia illucens TaxID=343691 RepID=A0A7R8UGF4_HERIL|nr:unnamed protein product [Hermetia illucens]
MWRQFRQSPETSSWRSAAEYNKAPDLDGVPNKALKLAVKSRPDMFAELFEACMSEGIFPAVWKRLKLVLLPKLGKPPGEPSSYRPICLLDTVGKVLERVIYNRLLPVVESQGGLSDRQYRFRKARSTIDAIKLVTGLAEDAIHRKGSSSKYCVVVTLDVKNAFNSANWNLIRKSLAKVGIPAYLAAIVDSHLTERRLWYDTDDGSQEYVVSAGVPQDSVLGPLLWNIMYNDVLNPLPEEATVVGYADDIALVVVAKHLEDAELYSSEAISAVKCWLESSGLTLAEGKTGAVFITKRRKRNYACVRVGNHIITSKPAIKYLGVVIDRKLSYKQHVQYVCDKSSKASMALARMMPNVGGPRHTSRLFIARVVTSIMLYVTPVWSEALRTSVNTSKLNAVYRRTALRVCSAFRTVSDDAAFVISGMMPIDILADEMANIYHAKPISPLLQTKKAERERSINRWQERWERSGKGRWTHRLIPAIKEWLERRHGEINYNLTQFLTGHGGYLQYLHRFKLETSPDYPNCNRVREDPEHVFFHCPRFVEERKNLEETLGEVLVPENLVRRMLACREDWDAINSMVVTNHSELRKAEETRKARLRTPRRDERGPS